MPDKPTRTKIPTRVGRAVARMIADHDARMRPRHHPCLGRVLPTTKIGTVRLNGGPLVRPETLAAIEAWQTACGLTNGRVLDQLVIFGQQHTFVPQP
jgi:hypothetical protein